MYQNSHIAIIGSSGYLGTVLSSRLPGSLLLNSSNIDLFTSEAYPKLFSDIKACIFLAGNPRLYYYRDKPYECFRSNAMLLEKLSDCRFEYFLFASSVAVYSDLSDISDVDRVGWNTQTGFYGISKLFAEKAVSAARLGSDLSILRFSTFWSPEIRKGPLYDIACMNQSYVDPNSSFSFLSTNDAAQSIITCITGSLTGTFNVTADSSVRLCDIQGYPSEISQIENTYFNYGSDLIHRIPGWRPTSSIHTLSYPELSALYNASQ